MIGQVRIYTAHPGRLDDFLELFQAEIVPFYAEIGIGIDSIWLDRDTDQVIWLRTYTDEASKQAQERAFYESEVGTDVIPRLRALLVEQKNQDVVALEGFSPTEPRPVS